MAGQRKTIVKEVVFTTVKSARMEINENGMPVAVPVDDKVFIGHLTLEKAQREMSKLMDGVTVFQVIPEKAVYKMPLEKFIELAERVEPSANE